MYAGWIADVPGAWRGQSRALHGGCVNHPMEGAPPCALLRLFGVLTTRELFPEERAPDIDSAPPQPPPEIESKTAQVYWRPLAVYQRLRFGIGHS